MSNATVILRTGAEVPRHLLLIISIALEKLDYANRDALAEVTRVARDGSFVPVSYIRGILFDLGLIKPDGTMHELIRQIVLASTWGDGSALRLMPPLPVEEAS